MEQIRESGRLVRKALMVALVLGVVLSPFFYHLVSFLLLPILIPLGIIFIFVYFTGLTDFERKKMIILNIVLSVAIIVVYEGYLIFVVSSSGHSDIHLNITIWIVQIFVVNFLLIFYQSVQALRKLRETTQNAEV